MKHLSLFLACLLLVLTVACSEEESEQQLIVDSCAVIANSKILLEEFTPCNFNTVYRYRSDIYITCECCLCDKQSFAINCDSILLCDIDELCMGDFYKEAIELFRVEGF